MTKSSFKTSTAIVMALSIAQPLPGFAQTEFPEGAICADGAEPPCAEGVELILPEDALPADEQTPETVLTEEAPADAPTPVEEVEPEEVEPLPEVVLEEEAAAEAKPEASAQDAPDPEPETEETVLPDEEAVEAETPVEVEAPAEEPQTPVEESAEEKEAVAEERPVESPEAESTVDEITDEQGSPAVEEIAPEEPKPEVPAGEAPAIDAPLEAPAAEEVSIPQPEVTEEIPEVEEILVIVPGAEEFSDEAAQVLDLLGEAVDAEDGEGEAPVAAAADPEAAEVAETVETEITEEGSRQSNEDFSTTASGAAREVVEEASGLSDLEKSALIGLGILAAGAVLSNGDEVVSNTGDRVVVRRGEDEYYVLKDDDTLLRRPGSNVRTERFNDGSTRSTVTREDGVKIITIRDASGRVLRRVREDVDGVQVLLIDDTKVYEPVELDYLPEPVNREIVLEGDDPLAARIALEREFADRSYSLRQVRHIERVRKQVPEITLNNITFASGSAAIEPEQARNLIRLGDLMRVLIQDNPGEVFLIEGHTDAVGSASYNLALSDRRAETLALALTEYFGVSPENMVVQGYGESDLKINTLDDEILNRRVAVRRITPLLDQRLVRN